MKLFKGQSYLAIQKFILHNRRPEVKPNHLKGCPNGDFLLRLMNLCWSQDATMRPSFPDIIAILEDHKDVFIPPKSSSNHAVLEKV